MGRKLTQDEVKELRVKLEKMPNFRDFDQKMIFFNFQVTQKTTELHCAWDQNFN